MTPTPPRRSLPRAFLPVDELCASLQLPKPWASLSSRVCEDRRSLVMTGKASVAGSRSEYLRVDPDTLTVDVISEQGIRLASDDERTALADLLLDASRDTVDDEGEDVQAARQAADDFLRRRIATASVVIENSEHIVSMSFVTMVDGRVYIDPVATASSWKRKGLGRRAVSASLQRLHDADVHEVGATITDGNVPSERLFASLSFVRLGPWGQGSRSSELPSRAHRSTWTLITLPTTVSSC